MEKVYETFPGYCSDTYITAIRPQLHDVFGPLVPSVEDNSLYQFHTATEDTHFSIKYGDVVTFQDELAAAFRIAVRPPQQL